MPGAGMDDESIVSKASRTVSVEVFNRAMDASIIKELYRIGKRKEKC